MRRTGTVFSIVAMIFAIVACKPDPFDADVSNVNVPKPEFQRFEQDLFAVNPSNFDIRNEELKKKYGPFYGRFLFGIVGMRVADSASVLPFVRDKDMKEAFKESQKVLSADELNKLESDLELLMKRFHYFFPKRKLPHRFVTYMGGFNYNIVYADSTLGVGLEMYLGENHPFYGYLRWPKFKTRVMNKNYIVPDIARAWMINEFDNTEPEANLLNHMIFYGKIFYACDALLPEVHDSVKIGYTTAGMRYMDEYEKNVWSYFAEKNRLFENSRKTIIEFTEDGPFTGAISKECPPRVGMYIGWQIVRSYMKNNEKVTLEELMNEKDAQKILNRSKYRP